MLAGVGACDTGICISGAESRCGVAKRDALEYEAPGSTPEFTSVGGDSCPDSEAGYAQGRPVNWHREQAGFSRLQRTFDLVQLLQVFFRGGRCLFPGLSGMLMVQENIMGVDVVKN